MWHFIFRCLSTLHTVLHNGCTNLNSTNVVQGFHFLHPWRTIPGAELLLGVAGVLHLHSASHLAYSCCLFSSWWSQKYFPVNLCTQIPISEPVSWRAWLITLKLQERGSNLSWTHLTHFSSKITKIILSSNNSLNQCKNVLFSIIHHIRFSFYLNNLEGFKSTTESWEIIKSPWL